MRMCRYIVCALIFFLCSYAESPFQPYWPYPRYQAQSFMFTRPFAVNVAMREALWHNIVYEKKNICRSGLQIIGTYQHSIASAKNNYYFLLDCQTTLLVSGDANKNDEYERNIRAEWLQLPAYFKGKMTVHPEQTQSGFLVEYHQDFANFFKIEFLQDYWLSILVPVAYVCNNIGLQQWNIQNSGTSYPADIIQAFSNPSWNFSKMCGPRALVRPADIYLRLGKVYYNKNSFQLIYYSGLTIPTSQGQDPAYLFYPFAGMNGHFGSITGLCSQILLSCGDIPYAATFFVDVESIFLFRNNQFRTFDLCCKPLSRYMLFVRNHSLPHAYTPGVNVLTRKVRVHPFFMVDFACGFRVKNDTTECELGYGIWGHGDERLELKCYRPCSESDLYGIAGSAPKEAYPPGVYEAVTASKSTIRIQAPYDKNERGQPLFVPIRDSDIDLLSGASRSAMNHKIFASIGLQKNYGYAIAVFGAGLFVEIPQFSRTTLQTAGIWVKCSIVF